MTRTNSIAKIAAVAAGLGLVAMSFAAFAPAARAAFTMDLTVGSTGAEVTALQTWLIAEGYSIPAGATGYFGAQTQAAVAAFQAANGISPAAGYFGPITRAKVNAGGGTTGGSTGGSSSGSLGGGEASLEDFDVKDGDDDEIDEGATGEIAVFQFDVEDADVELQRLDLSFTHTPFTGEEDEPWEAFDTITIYVNGDEVASEDVSDEDDWLDDDTDATTTFRFSGLDAIVEEGDRAEISVEVEAAGNVDGSDTDVTWNVFVEDDGIRGTDGEGLEQEIGDSDDSTSFDIVEEGQGEELNVKTSPEDPDASVLQVEDDETSDWYTVLAFELEAEESDIELDSLPVNFTVAGENVDDVINDVKLVIDGEEYDDYDWTNAHDAFGSSTFDIDGDVTIGEGEEVTVEVMVEFASTASGNYAAGQTVIASIADESIDGEGSDDLVSDGSVTGDTHTLQLLGINVELVSKSADGNSVDGVNNDFAEYEIVVDVSAFNDDIFISENAGTAFTYRFENASTGATLTVGLGTSSASVSSDADVTGGSYRIDEGDTEEFTFSATLDPATANEGAQYRFQLLTIVFGTSTAGVTASSTWNAEPQNEYQTSGVLIGS